MAQVFKGFEVDQKVKGTVSKVSDAGVTLELSQGVEGFIRKEKIPPTITFTVGKEITATVASVDTRRRRVMLTPVLLEKPIGYR